MTPANATTVTELQIHLEPHERQPCEIWTRVMGYHRPVASFNAGKQGEYAERRFYCETRVAARLAV